MRGGGDSDGVVMARYRAKRVVSFLRTAAPQAPDANQILLDIREELRQALQPRAIETPPRAMADIAVEWLPRKLRQISSADSFGGRVRNHLLPALGHHTSATLKKRDVEAFLWGLAREGGLSPQTVNHVRDAGRQLVEDAMANGDWAGVNPFAQVSPLELEEKDYDVLSRVEAAKTLLAVPDRWRPLFAVALYLGADRSTLLNARVEAVDLVAGVISYTRMKTKKKVRKIPIPSELLPYLQEAVRRAGAGEWLFPNRFGNKHAGNPKALNRVLLNAMKAAGLSRPDGGLPRLTFHGLRRTSSCLHQEAGCPGWVVSKILGHSQASLVMMGNIPENMTAKTYSVYGDVFVRECLNRLTLKLEDK